MCQEATNFQAPDDLPTDGAQVYYHDENCRDEKPSIWLSDADESRLRKIDGKGKRIPISTMITENSFNEDTVDIFTCDEEHSLNSIYFVN